MEDHEEEDKEFEELIEYFEKLNGMVPETNEVIVKEDVAFHVKNIRILLLQAARLKVQFDKADSEDLKKDLKLSHTLTLMSVYEEAKKMVKE